MKISRSLLTLFTAGAVLGFTQYSGFAKDTVSLDPEPVQYVRVCDAYGAGYFYIPGTDTCMKISGEVYSTMYGGGDLYARTLAKRNPKKWRVDTRAVLNFATASDTELGTLRSFIRMRGDWGNPDDVEFGKLRLAYLELGGLRVGLDESAFNTFLGYYGDFLTDDVVSGGGYRTNVISYTYNNANGFSAIVSLEQGNNEDVSDKLGYKGNITDYTPHVVLGAKYAQDWGSLTGAAAYDSVNHKWFGKAKVSLNVTDKLNVWGMAAYKNMEDTYYSDVEDKESLITNNSRGVRAINSFYGTWGGRWAGWVGASYTFSEKTTGNLQFSYEGAGTFHTAANVEYQIVPGLKLIPEIAYTKWNDSKSELKGKDAIGGALRLTRQF